MELFFHKKTSLLLLFAVLLSATLIFSSCSEKEIGNTLANETGFISESAETVGPAETSFISESAVTFGSPETSLPLTEDTDPVTESKKYCEIPEEFFEPHGIVSCSSLIIDSEYNDISKDVNGYISEKDGIVYFFMPCRADLSQVVYSCVSTKGNKSLSQVADFTDDVISDTEKVKINGKEYTIKAIQSNAPSLFVDLSEEYPSFEDIRADKSKQTKGYGYSCIDVTDEKANEKGWKTFYESVDSEEEKPLSCSLKGRGNWSWLDVDKKGYLLRWENSENLFGMGKGKKWVLIANVTDPSSMRNQIAFELAKRIGLDFTTDYCPVDLYVCGNYIGSYLMLEKIEIKESRVNIRNLEELTEKEDEDYGRTRTARLSYGATIKYWENVESPEDITGGYIFEMDIEGRTNEEASWIKTSRGYCFSIISPEYVSKKEAEYLARLIQEFEDAIFSSDGRSPKTKRHYSEIIDVDSMILKYWLDEIMRNTDAQITSVFFYKPSDSESTRFKAGPPWDYDNTFGTVEDYFARHEGYYAKLFEFEDFRKRVNELYLTVVYPETRKMVYDSVIDDIADSTGDSVRMNNIIWNSIGNNDYDKFAADVKNFFAKRTSFFFHSIR